MNSLSSYISDRSYTSTLVTCSFNRLKRITIELAVFTMLVTSWAVGAAVPTTTTLNLSSSSVPSGTTITMTSSVSNGTPITTGQVSFCDANAISCVQPKAWRKFRLKGKSKKKSAKDRFIPVPAKLVWRIKERMGQRNAQPHDLVFPNGEGKPDGHFLRKLKAIAKKAGVEGVELHRFRKTYADTLHEEGVSVNTIRIRLGQESLDVTLAYLKGKDAESEEAQEHANSSSLALYA